jgi:hypothetical protein
VHGFELLVGPRVVADPLAVDAATWHGDGPVIVLRLASDDAFGIGAEGVDVDDAHAIVVREDGFVGRLFAALEFERDVLPHIEWSLPSGRPALAQGAVAGVPAKVWFMADEAGPGSGSALVITWAAYAAELAQRLRVP